MTEIERQNSFADNRLRLSTGASTWVDAEEPYPIGASDGGNPFPRAA
ncbi:hypothetical protein [Nocardia abscessus]|nr:hypothetical protein [Nocardia abscessus]